MACDVYGDHVAAAPAATPGIGVSTTCPGADDPISYSATSPPGGMAIWTVGNKSVPHGTAVHWTAQAPSGLTIASVYIPHMYSHGIDDGQGWGGGYFWSGGSSNVNTFDGETGWSSSTTSGPHFTWPSGGSPYFGWQVVCGASPCSNGGSQWLSVELLELTVRETSAPYLVAPDGLWQATGWIRGQWPLHFYGDSPSGLCHLSASLNSHGLTGSDSGQNLSAWHQCSAPAVNEGVDTSQYGNGAVPLVIGATDATGASVFRSESIDVDNVTPTISLAGPTDAPATAGAQYIDAAASAGPSGVAGISCSIDGAPAGWYAGPSAQIPVQGVGVHHLSCESGNNAHDQGGNRGASAPATWTLSIRTPAVSTVSFARVADALRCKSMHERVRIPARWVTARHDGRPLKVKLPAQVRTVKVVHCHPRVIRSRVRVHGHWRAVRAVVLPHSVLRSSEKVRAGSSATVSGWLGTIGGNALGSQPVRVLTAPDNGKQNFTQVATAITSANGDWTARIPAGPSRLVVAAYAGGPTSEPALSTSAHLVVPASVSLRITPRSTHWGGRIAIAGRLRGGYIPPGGELVVLRIGWPGGSTEIGHLYTRPDGTFASEYTFLRGNGTETYRLWATTARESGYPFAPGRSRSARITVRP
jgi:hypothetical protein